MSVLTVPKSQFKPRAFEYLRRVQAGERICITDRGHPVVDLSPHGSEDDELLCDMRGLVTRFEDPVSPVGDEWEADA